MNVAEWIAFAGLAMTLLGGLTTVVGRLIRHERRLGMMLTREEHEQICRERNERVERVADDLREDMERRHQENRETLNRIESAVAGTHRRIDSILMPGRREG
jgi:hypothetical protein